MKLEELKKTIESIDITYDYEETYCNLYNAVIDYQNETQDWTFEYIFERFYSYDVVEDIAKYELERGGLIRLWHFLNGADNLNDDLYIIDAYGNLQNIEKEDLEYLKSEILENIDIKLKEKNDE